MSIGSLGIVGGLAALPLSQQSAEIDRAQRETAERSREAKSNLQAEAAAGIGQTEEDAQASERDADGRRPWEIPARPQPGGENTAGAEQSSSTAKDPFGETGSQLDLLV